MQHTPPKKPTITSIHINKKANFDYESIESFEAGVILTGWEVKSLRAKHTQLKGSFVSLKTGLPVVHSWHISPYSQGGVTIGQSPLRDKTLLLKSRDILKLREATKSPGMSLIPSEIYLKGNLIKVRVTLARGRKNYNKKQLLKERTLEREAQKMMKRY